MIILALIGIAAYAVYYIQLVIYQRWWNHGLTVAIGFKDSSLFEGDEVDLVEVIENRKALPLPMLTVKFQTDRSFVFAGAKASQATDQFYRNDVFRVGRREKITRTLTFIGKKRGYYRINKIEMLTSDLFLSTSMMDSKRTDKFIHIYPRPFQSEEFRLSLQQINGEVLTKRHLYEDPFEFRGIRPYQPYDELRHVNWKATAKTRELKVNQKNYTSTKTIRIFFNVEDTGIRKKSEAVETSLRLVAGLAEFFLSQGMQVACYGNGRDIIDSLPLHIEASGGSDHMEYIYKALARQDLKQNAASFREEFEHKLLTEDHSVMTFFVAPNAYDDFVETIVEYKATGTDFVWFYPSADKQPPEVPKELYGNIKVISF